MEKTAEQIAAEQQLEMLADEPAPESESQAQDATSTVAAQFTPEESLAGLLKIGHHALMLGGMRNTAAVWNQNACEAFAGAAVPVLRKYPWGGKVLAFLESGAGVEEMALFAVVMPLTMATINAVKLDTAPKEPEKPAEQEPEQPTRQYEPVPADECAADVDRIPVK